MGVLEKDNCAPSVDIDGFVNNITIQSLAIACTNDGELIFAFGGAFSDDITGYLVFTIMMLLCSVTVFGNAAVITCFVKSARLHSTNYSVYVMSLAVSDMLLGGVCMTSMSLYTILGYWPLGSTVCTVWIIIDFACCSVSNLHLDVVAYDRYRAVADPLAYRSNFTRNRAQVITAITWTVCFIFYIPGIAVVRILDEQRGTLLADACYYPANEIYMVGSFVLTIYGPILFMVILSVLLLIKLRMRKKSQTNQMSGGQTNLDQNTGGKDRANSSANPTQTAVDVTLANSALSNEEKKIDEQNRRVLITLLAQVILFGLCWFPWCVVFIMPYICATCVPPVVIDITYWMGYVDSLVNPFLYFVVNKEFREEFLRVFCRRTCKRTA